MSKIIESTLISADGVVDSPGDWALPYFNDEFAQEAADLLHGCDAMLLGRGTYDELSRRWPGQTGIFADAINGIRKYVFSSTLETAEWNNSVIVRGDVVKEVTKLKEESQKNLLMFGHGQLSHTLLASGLLDVLRLAVHPVIVGQRGGGFPGNSQTPMRLINTHPRKSGVVVLTYETARS
ncbi:dihydrofolate reductase family protein [Kribbella sp. NPDC023855]|uniref:dihydrofolate reductase family protein n=1 Tax=Kribbella sp. NPDC023855 TaxID=3154698 RepID=UPI0033C304F0